MSIVKNIKKFTNDNIINTLNMNFIPQQKIKSYYSPFKSNNTNNSFRNTLDKLNHLNKNKKSSTIKKSKNKSKDSEILINNYLSQRPRVNTEGNDINLVKMKFSRDFLKNRFGQIFKINTNKSNTNKKISIKNNQEDNFRTTKKNNNLEKINLIKIQENKNINIKNISNFQLSKMPNNNANSYNKKIIEKSSNTEYNNFTNTQNFSQTKSYSKPNKNKNKSSYNNNYNNNYNQLLFENSEKMRHRNNTKSEDIRRKNFPNNKIVKESKMKNFSGLFQQISPQYLTKNKISHIQNYFKNIHKNKKTMNNQKTKDKKVLTTEPKDLNDINRLDTEEYILKDNSNYLVVTKNPTQITNIIEKKENNKYINNYFNICESANITNKKVDFCKNNNKCISFDENEYDTYEEIHFYFINKIQQGKIFDLTMNNKKS